MKDLKKLMGKDEEHMGMKKDAKLSVLKELRKMASDMMGEDVKGGLSDKIGGMKKVTVASPSEEGLDEGLEKAQEIVGDEESEDEGYDEMTDWSSDLSKYSPEELDAKIAELQAAKEKLSR